MSSETITFGPPGQELHYSKSSKTYDLYGGSVNKLSIPTTEGPGETSISIAPDSTALVIVDMQNFFLDSKCMKHPNGLKAIEPIIKVMEKCREAGIQVSPAFNLSNLVSPPLNSRVRLTFFSTDNLAELGFRR